MASIHRQDDKPNYFCAFFDPEGFRRFRSTGSENKKIASQICSAIERASNLARQGKLSNEKGLRLIRETSAAIEEAHGKLLADRAAELIKANVEEFICIAGGELTSYTIKSWVESWLTGRTDASKATIIEYRRIVDLFVKFLGTRAEKPLTTLNTKQVEDFKVELSKRVGPSTVNKAIKVLNASLNNAVLKRQIESNPAEPIENVQYEQTERRQFTIDEVKNLLTAADEEWKTMILMGFYTGLRLRDCANINWSKIDLLGNLLDVTPMKTRNAGKGTARKRLVIPIADALSKRLNTIAGDKPDAPLCPSLWGKTASWLSAQFYDVMVKAKLVKPRDAKKKRMGKGRDAQRKQNEISFHSLRYNTSSGLRSAGVSEGVAMYIRLRESCEARVIKWRVETGQMLAHFSSRQFRQN